MVASNPQPAEALNPAAIRADHCVRPAFRSDLRAFFFLLLIVIVLVAPVLLAAIQPRDRVRAYQRMRETDGATSFVQHEIFDLKEDVGVLFLGNSALWNGVNSAIVEEVLTSRLGRHTRVLTFGSNWPSFDVPYVELRDALEHKRVGMVVISIPRVPFYGGPSAVGFRLLGYDDPPDVIADVPFKYRLMLYADYVLRSPRDLLDTLRPVRSHRSIEYTQYNGSRVTSEGFDQAFTSFTPPVPDLPGASLIYSSENLERYRFTAQPLPEYHAHFLRKVAGLLQSHHIPLVVINIPQYSERSSDRIIERQRWPDVLGSGVFMVGTPPATLFRGVAQDIRKLYASDAHFNRNGNALFSRAIAPALATLYAQTLPAH